MNILSLSWLSDCSWCSPCSAAAATLPSAPGWAQAGWQGRSHRQRCRRKGWPGSRPIQQTRAIRGRWKRWRWCGCGRSRRDLASWKICLGLVFEVRVVFSWTLSVFRFSNSAEPAAGVSFSQSFSRILQRPFFLSRIRYLISRCWLRSLIFKSGRGWPVKNLFHPFD